MFREDNGRITSPGWPSSYPTSQNCWMNITAPDANARIALYFNTFVMESHNECNYDYLEVSLPYDTPVVRECASDYH